jgi:subtilase family serine protease
LFCAAAGVAALTSSATAHADTDLGPTDSTTTVSASLVLKVKNSDFLESYVASTQQPFSWNYHRFLSVKEFANTFAPSNHDISVITNYLAKFGIVVNEVYADRLVIKATGTADAFDQAFNADLHDYSDAKGRHHRPHHHPQVPLLLRDLLVSIQGLSNETGRFKPMNRHSSQVPKIVNKPAVLPASGVIATGVPGDFTVGDVANMYDINPVYDAGIDGTGSTIGIATLAGFVPDDAFLYWGEIGLDVDPNRLTQVHVDGGGVVSGPAGSGETSLDVEQSGGLAPGANMVVYDAPNTDVGFIDLFYKAASDNLVDSLSVSWGEAEPFYFESVTGEDRTALIVAFHQAFLESAAQGISLFASAGDNGAYDMNDAFNDPVTNVLVVDVPGSDPAITAAGGTTTPGDLGNILGIDGAPDLMVSTEQVWGWDYLENYLIQVTGDPTWKNALFPVGTGGGVSFVWPRPWYQDGVHGIRKTEPNQSVIFDPGDGTGPQDLLDIPAHYAGRNLPDISLDADPFTGFLIESSTDGGLSGGNGGTSFVAPQLNGITSLLVQANGGRMGLLNPMLYRFKAQHGGNHGSSPIVDITAGDNYFYQGVKGYEPGAGLGVLDVAKLVVAVTEESCH